jgi:hypothetical protein
VRIGLKVLIFFLVNITVIYAVINTGSTNYNPKEVHTYIKPLYAKPHYKYFAHVNAVDLCNETFVSQADEKIKSIVDALDNKANVVYLDEVSVLSCKDYIQLIAEKLHAYKLEIAINLELKNEQSLSETDNEKIKQLYQSKFKDLTPINDWVDYIVFDNAMNYLTFADRRAVQVELRKLFYKPFIGFRFTSDFNTNPESTHPNRQDKLMNEFLPKDDDGDFIIVSFALQSTFKRTKVYGENNTLKNLNLDGEFIP